VVLNGVRVRVNQLVAWVQHYGGSEDHAYQTRLICQPKQVAHSAATLGIVVTVESLGFVQSLTPMSVNLYAVSYCKLALRLALFLDIFLGLNCCAPFVREIRDGRDAERPKQGWAQFLHNKMRN
jgi:hypothetical protein